MTQRFTSRTMDAVFGAVSSLAGVAIGGAASLLGVALGAAAAYFGQVRQWKRITRFEGYRRFAGSCADALDCLLDVRHALVVDDFSQFEINAAWQRATTRFATCRGFSARWRPLPVRGGLQRSRARQSFESTQKAAKALRDYLTDVKATLFALHQSRQKPEKREGAGEETYQDEFEKYRDPLASAADEELRLH